MQEMIYLDYDGKRTNDVFGISDERVDEICTKLADISKNILEHHEVYSYKENDVALMHKGKILQTFINSFEQYQEKLFIVSCFDKIIQILQAQHNKKLMHDHVDKFLKSLV